QGFAYPVYVVFVLAPTVKLPFSIVLGIFWVLLVSLTAWSVPLWFRALGWRVSPSTSVCWMILACGCFPAIQGFKLQQLTLLVAALLALSISALAEGQFVLAGV